MKRRFMVMAVAAVLLTTTLAVTLVAGVVSQDDAEAVVGGCVGKRVDTWCVGNSSGDQSRACAPQPPRVMCYTQSDCVPDYVVDVMREKCVPWGTGSVCQAEMGLCGEAGGCKCKTLTHECVIDDGEPKTKWPYQKPK